MELEAPPPDILERLEAHRTVGKAPRAELEWLAAHGKLRRFEPGEYVVHTGQTLSESTMGMEVMLTGHFVVMVDRGAGPRRVMEWNAGDITGVLPFSRMTSSPGDSIVDARMETLSIARDLFPEMIRECPAVTAICVHVMVDRARVFNTSDWQHEKIASLGKLAAGLAHELNNPASAIARGGKRLRQVADEADVAVRTLALAQLSEDQLAAINRVRDACTWTGPAGQLSPLQRAERENEITTWLGQHGEDDGALEGLVDAGVTVEQLEELGSVLEGEALAGALHWVAASCAVRALAEENDQAGTHISDLVGAMKRMTYMDRAPVPEPLDLEQGLRDTVMILGNKARMKSATIDLEIPADLPRVYAIGGELNQVWMHLLENALDAVGEGGHVTVTAAPEGHSMAISIIDDGVGIPPENKTRVFDPFFTTKEPGMGTGLGLEVARTRVRGNGGDITFESEPGRTEFCVFLPLRAGK